MCGKGQVKPMQCTYCGRDIPDDAVWCPYCGAEQTPPDESAPPDGWQDENIPVGDWDDEADPPPDNTWVDDPPVPGWEDDTPYEPAPEDQDAPRSKALLIAIFAALGVALIVLLIALNVKPKPKPAAGGYILPDSTTRRLTQADVAGLTWEQCCLARNEIYARHGRIFQTPQIAAYFEAQSWYHGTVPGASFDNNTLSPIEHANVDFLTSYENATWGHSYY